jgi:DNA gyrase subunit A
MNDDIFDKPSEAEIDKIHEVDLKEKMETFYIDYAMSVIASRALPDVRDGLKPVQRRVLYSMIELNNGPDKPHRKSARIVGDTMGKYHPHGDSSIYGALVNMAQDWSTRYPLVDGHGNFGSMDGDGAAAMRYTEARLSKISMELLADIGKNTVDFVPNFDDTEKEPVVLPSRYPNLLVNGTTGIAVGMATNIPPHNLREVVQAVVKIIDNRVEEDRDTTIDEILPIVKAPDFPTGGLILGTRGCEEAYRTGRGKIRVRAVTNIETLPNGKSQIIATELPYMVNKANLIIKIAELVKLKKIYPNGEFVLFIGSDQLFDFQKWYRYQDILKLARVRAITRQACERRAVTDFLAQNKDLAGISVLVAQPVVVSSTQIRQRVAQGECIADLVPAAVADYIMEKGLYRG